MNSRILIRSNAKLRIATYVFVLIVVASPIVLGKLNSHILSGMSFIALTSIASIVLLVKSPSYYISFCIWLWLLTPLIRRLIDFQSGFSVLNYYALAPIIATLLCLFSIDIIIKNIRTWSILLFSFIAVLYGYMLGVLKVGILPASHALTEWIVPLVISIYIASNWKIIEQMKGVFVNTLMLGISVVGLYSLVQYFYLPGWDAYWMKNIPMTSIGQPLPFQVRVFSTLNSPMVLGPIIAAGIIVTLNTRSIVGLIASSLGSIALLLSLVRSSWGALLLGLVVLSLFQISRSPDRFVKLTSKLLILLIALALGIGMSPLYERLEQRFDTMKSIKEDVSYEERQQLYNNVAEEALTEIVGKGLGAVGKSQVLKKGGTTKKTAFDSGILEIPLLLGLGGAILFFIPFVVVIYTTIKTPGLLRNEFYQSSLVVIIIYLAQLPFANRLTGPAGVILFMLIGFLLAARKYEKYNSSKKINADIAIS
ncbi:MAG: O-antigen ligase family protein [Candidatus Thiodiazotropha sp. L084R]